MIDPVGKQKSISQEMVDAVTFFIYYCVIALDEWIARQFMRPIHYLPLMTLWKRKNEFRRQVGKIWPIQPCLRHGPFGLPHPQQ